MLASSESWTGVLEARYANNFRVGHNEYEFMFDFGQLHAADVAENARAAQVRIVRIVMGPPFAKAFLAALTQAIRDHEQLHGSVDQE